MASEREALPDSLRIGGQELHGKDAFLEALETERDPFTARVLDFCARWCGPGETMLLHTSGSTGTPKPFLAGKREMAASAAMTVRRLGLKAGDRALLCLPLDYIAGQMVVVRAMLAGLELVPVTPSRHPFAGLAGSIGFAALVPLQVKASLEVPEERDALRAVRELIIGGAAVDPGLASELKGFPHEVWSTYGMTETLSHVALRPLSGPEAGSWYEPLDGVAVSSTERGTLAIEAPALGVSRIETNDLVLFRPGSTRFRILGRVDNVIDSGGIKVPAEQVEEALREVSPELSGFVRMAVERGWVDAKPSERKIGGAFYARFEEFRVARVFSTYAGTTASGLQQGHELGHAFHYWVMRDLSPVETRFPMTLTETASTFNEAVIRRHLLGHAALGDRFGFL